MEVSEIIGIIVLVLALLLPVARRALERRVQHKDPEGFRRAKEEKQRKQKKQFVHLQRTLLEPQQFPSAEPAEPEVLPEQPSEVTTTESRKPESPKRRTLDPPPYPSNKVKVEYLLARWERASDLIVAHEILSPPVCLREGEH